MEHEKGKLILDGYTYACNEQGKVIFTTAHKNGVHPEIQTANAAELVRRWNAFEGLLAVAKELADIFPENDMAELDAADFVDSANRIFVVSQKAKAVILAARKD